MKTWHWALALVVLAGAAIAGWLRPPVKLPIKQVVIETVEVVKEVPIEKVVKETVEVEKVVEVEKEVKIEIIVAATVTPTLVPSAMMTPPPIPKEVVCHVNLREPLPDRIACNVGSLEVEIGVVGETDYPSWDRVGARLVSRWDFAPQVTGRVRVEEEVEGWLTFVGECWNDMEFQYPMWDEISGQVVAITPNDMSQEALVTFPTCKTRVVARAYEHHDGGGIVITFTYIPPPGL